MHPVLGASARPSDNPRADALTSTWRFSEALLRHVGGWARLRVHPRRESARPGGRRQLSMKLRTASRRFLARIASTLTRSKDISSAKQLTSRPIRSPCFKARLVETTVQGRPSAWAGSRRLFPGAKRRPVDAARLCPICFFAWSVLLGWLPKRLPIFSALFLRSP
jgi:hypothetical protein